MRDRLIALLKSRGVTDNPLKFVTKELAERLADYLLANGVIVPPCKVGQEVWLLSSTDSIIATQVEKIVLKEKGLFLKLGCNRFYETSCSSIGKTVFFSLKEAEKALAERRNGDAD